MQQIKIANMNANDPAMTIISPMNAGMLVVNTCICICFVSLILTGFWFQFYGTGGCAPV
jgi:hypothetical protein